MSIHQGSMHQGKMLQGKTYHKLCQVVMVAVLLGVFILPLRATAESLTLYAAGSLRAALTDVAAAYEHQYGTRVETRFAPSGLLRAAIEGGEMPDVFASANMAHPTVLAESGWGGPVALFTRNQLCALAQPNVAVTPDTLLQVLLSESIRVGTSTPKADPSGDYAWELFKKAEAVQAGSYGVLDGKALQLTGGPDSPKAPEGRNLYAWVMDEKQADVFLTYCTNAVLAQREAGELKQVRIPEALAVGADYGLIVRKGAESEAWRLAMFIVSPVGQQILADYGFSAAGVPQK